MRVPSELSGARAARRILQDAGVGPKEIRIEEHDGYFTDCYDPVARRLRLSRKNFRGRSAAAWGVALHEVGHALQHRDREGGFHGRIAAIRACQYLCGAALLIVVFLGLSRAVHFRIGGLVLSGIWLACFLANLFTVPVEFGANSKVRDLLHKSRLAGSREEDVLSAMGGRVWADVGAVVTTLSCITYRLLPMSGKLPGKKSGKRDRSGDED